MGNLANKVLKSVKNNFRLDKLKGSWKFLPGSEFIPYVAKGIEEDRNNGVPEEKILKKRFPKYFGRLFLKTALVVPALIYVTSLFNGPAGSQANKEDDVIEQNPYYEITPFNSNLEHLPNNDSLIYYNDSVFLFPASKMDTSKNLYTPLK